MKILVLGGDGYLGWPTAMHLSTRGHDVLVVDNYLRRRLCQAEDVEPLHEVPNLRERCQTWEARSGNRISLSVGDLRDWDVVCDVFSSFEPEAVIHYAEQPSAPYSVHSRRAAQLTLHNNLGVTFNLIYAVREFNPSIHIVKLGTMGEYGTPNIDIEEGWLPVIHKGRKHTFLYPRQASSLYHTTKIMDTDLLWYYVRMWNLRVTDLMQGPVYGIRTTENEGRAGLVPFFNYDELFGTVVNRFVVQAACGHPLTIYGSGGQTRGYINLKDTLNCVRLSIEHPAKAGELRIFNQFTETFSVKELAQRVQRVGDGLGLSVSLKHISNPRKEAQEHYYNPAHTGLLDLGLEPHFLTDDVLSELIEYVLRFKKQIRKDRIYRGTRW